MQLIAHFLKSLGKQMNEEIEGGYNRFSKQLSISNDYQRYWLAVIMGCSFAVGGLGSYYDNFIGHVYRSTINNPNPSSINNAVFAKGFPGTNKITMANALIFHAQQMRLHGVSKIIQDPVKYQQQIINAALRAPNVGQWSATIPFKILAIAGILPEKVINSLEPPLGRNVINGIEALTGYKIRDPNNSHNRAFSNALHRYLAQLAQTDIYTINSGLWELGT